MQIKKCDICGKTISNFQKYCLIYKAWTTWDGWDEPDFCESCSRAVMTAVNQVIAAGKLANNTNEVH